MKTDGRMLFATPLLTTVDAVSDADIAALRETILEQEARDSGVQRSNLGGWQSSQTGFKEWGGEPARRMLAAAGRVCSEYTVQVSGGEIQGRPASWQVAAWANVNRQGAGNAAHVHPGVYWSGCFYVDDGGIDGRDHLGGAIEFSDPRGAAPVMVSSTLRFAMQGGLTAGRTERVYPRRGLMLIFPSWLHHAVLPYTGSAARISIAFNLSAGA